MSALADFIRDGCSARPEDKVSALAQLAVLETRIKAQRRTLIMVREELVFGGNWEDARANIDRTLAAEERRSRVTEPWKLSDAIALWIRQRHPGEAEIPPWFVPVLKDWRDRAIALEVALACIERLEKVATIARRQLHKLRAANDPDALELTNALADLPPKEKPPLYAGSPSLRDWADMHGELHEEKP